MTILAIVDTETSDLTPNAQATEKGLILYDSKHGTIASLATLLPSAQNPEIEAITGITQNMIDVAEGLRLDDLETVFYVLLSKADYVVAHHAEFDKRFWEKQHPHWLCTLTDFQLTAYNGKRDLISIALAMGIPVLNPHRALNDCALIASIFDRFRFNGTLEDRLALAIQRSKSPTLRLVALSTKDQKDLVNAWRSANNDKFFWDTDLLRYKCSVKECDIIEPFPFRVMSLDDHLKRQAQPDLLIHCQCGYEDRSQVKEWRSAEGHQFRWNGESRKWEITLKEVELGLLDSFPFPWAIVSDET